MSDTINQEYCEDYQSNDNSNFPENEVYNKLSEIQDVINQDYKAIENTDVELYLNKGDDLRNLIKNLKNKIKLLEEKHEFSEVIQFYENILQKMKSKSISYIKLFTQIINTITDTNNNV